MSPTKILFHNSLCVTIITLWCQWEVVSGILTITVSFKGFGNYIAAIAMSNTHMSVSATFVESLLCVMLLMENVSYQLHCHTVYGLLMVLLSVQLT